MRVGIDYRAVSAAPMSGVARQIVALEAALRRRPDTDVRLFTAAPSDHPHRAIARCPDGASPLDGLHRPTERLRFEWRFLPAAIEEEALDVYIATINMGLPVGRVGSNTRLVLLMHDTFQITLRNRHASRLRETVYRFVDAVSIRHSVRVADAIWVPSHYVAETVGALFPGTRSKVQVLPNAVLSSLWTEVGRPAEGRLPSRFWLVVGTTEPRKNIAWFVQQWQQAGGSTLLPPLVLIGHPRDLPASLAALDGIHFLSRLTDAELAATYRAAERVWQPSYAEGFGLPVVEAAAAGTPVASARGSALDEVTPPGAPRFDPRGDEALRSLMLRLAASRRGDGESIPNLQAWARRFDMPFYAERVDRLIQAVAA